LVLVQPFVSVIMPAYNAERYIAASIQSVLVQTYSDWELIVVDDGSTDGTASVVRQCSASDSRVKYVYRENGRLGKARNTGIANSKGSLIAFLDADDLWLREKLERQVEALNDTKADVVFTNGFTFHGDDTRDETTTFPIVCGRFIGAQMLDLLLLENRIPVLSVLMRKETFNQAGPFEEDLPYHGSEDYDLWLKLAKHGAVFYGMDENLVRYRRHPMAMSYKESRYFKPIVRVVRRHINDGSLAEDQKRARLRSLYRSLVGALVAEAEFDQAKEYMNEFSSWDRRGLVTAIQKMVIRISPRSFNFVSRECLYRAEWHLRRFAGISQRI
jgi:teichuronic acid biosynthesis glycosyltransferase TuaG